MIHLCVECHKTCDCRFDGVLSYDECQLCENCNDAEDEREANDPIFMAELRAAFADKSVARVWRDPNEFVI